tara:strand:+ start:340 stop:879 length:540 start_codon:yes stop_codon:yes gene_type:complete
MNNKFSIYFLTMFGLGYSKYAPGTLASLITCLIYFYFYSIKLSWVIVLLIFIFVLINSIILIDKGSKNFKEIDAKEIVIDEFLGQSVPIICFYMIIYSLGFFDNEPTIFDKPIKFFQLLVSCFIFFRIFDIFKPFPINIVDKKMKNGLGVVLDDLIAGIYSFIATYFLGFFYVKYFMEF